MSSERSGESPLGERQQWTVVEEDQAEVSKTPEEGPRRTDSRDTAREDKKTRQ